MLGPEAGDVRADWRELAAAVDAGADAALAERVEAGVGVGTRGTCGIYGLIGANQK